MKIATLIKSNLHSNLVLCYLPTLHFCGISFYIKNNEDLFIVYS